MNQRAAFSLGLLLLFSFGFCPAVHAWDAYVVRVEDGTTISVCEKRGKDEPVVILRFYGIDAPALTQPYGREARDYLLKLLPKGTKVGVDAVGEDENGAVEALVQVNEASVTYQLLAEGLAWVNRSTCKAMFCRRWYIQEHQAVVNRRGLWSLNMSTPPWQWSR